MEFVLTIIVGLVAIPVGIAISLTFDTSCEELTPAPRGDKHDV